ncbi:MAG: phosphatidylglycerophosphatase A [Proteobacteria bacterium]|nr:phosphatidylglycerophosphatase A [Pseudomonadota bacterium]MCL2307875.1 phosphatidylglycerophosphatase A [Pseudomonadota bacterium]
MTQRAPIPPALLFRHPAHFIALGFGSGLLPRMPGTWGTLPAIPIALALHALHNDVLYLAVTLLLIVVGIWAAHITGQRLNEPDHSGIVIDEIAAFVLMLYFVDGSWQHILLAFVLFRFFDILKPPPIRYFDTRIKNGVGVMLDDLLAAAYALLTMVALLRAWDYFGSF